MKLWGILIPLWNTFSTYISPGYSNPWLPTRWDDPISKKKITCSWFSCTVFKNEFGVNIKVGEAVREKKILHNMVTGYSILSECTSMNILFLSLFLSSIILISFLTGNLFIIPRWYKILFFKKNLNEKLLLFEAKDWAQYTSLPQSSCQTHALKMTSMVTKYSRAATIGLFCM